MGLTVGVIVISYDVNRLHTEVKERMRELGYFDSWYYDGQKEHQMPNTTLWHKHKSSDAAIRDLKNVGLQLNVTLEKGVAVLAQEFAGI